MKEKLARFLPEKVMETEAVEAVEAVEEAAGPGTVPIYRLLLAAAVISLVVVGVTTLFFVLFRPVEEATVELPTEQPLEEMPVAEPAV